jgi:hypothetical protein
MAPDHDGPDALAKEARMGIWVVVLVMVIILGVIALGLALGAGSRAARKRGTDRSSAAKVEVVERPR